MEPRRSRRLLPLRTPWCLRLLAALAVLPVLYTVMIAGPAIFLSAEDPEPHMDLGERTSMTADERTSTLLAQWTFFRHLNWQLQPVLLPYLSESTRSLLATSPSPTSSTTSSSATATIAHDSRTVTRGGRSVGSPTVNGGTAVAGEGEREIPGTYTYESWSAWYLRVWREYAGGLHSAGPQPPPPLAQLCHSNILLRFAPWCGYEKAVLSEWLLDPEEGEATPETRRELREVAVRHIQSVSPIPPVSASLRRSQTHEAVGSGLTPHDRRMVEGIRWIPWQYPLDPGKMNLDGDQPAGSVFLRRTKVHYPVLLAMNKAFRPRAAAAASRDDSPYDAEGRLRGFHACMFGSRRNISSTFSRIQSHLLKETRPQRLTVVTSADGVEEYRGTIAERRAALYNSFLEVVGDAATSFIATERDLATTHHNCVICRGFFPREVCRAALLSELDRGVPVELVMIFRPDMYMWNPVTLIPYRNDQEVLPPSDAHNIENDDDDKKHNSVQGAEVATVKWRLHTKPLWSLVVDKGFLPTTFGVYNDINITKSTIVVHCRVTFPLDLHWIGDPVVVGHWHVMNHWLECFSVITASSRLKWIDDNAGETHHAAFYQRYMRPLFELGLEGKATEELEIRMFDFQFSLFRADPIVNGQLMALTPNYVAYQQQTIFRKFATKWEYGECMRYYFVPKQFNVSSFYIQPRKFFFGEIGRIKMVRMPQRICSQVKTPPGIQTCFAQYQRIVFYKKGRNVHNPCKPYCGVFPLLQREGMCAHVGNKGPRQRYIATFSATPMLRNDTGEVLRFNLVNPQYVRGDTLWFEKQKARDDARKEKEEREKLVAEKAVVVVVAAPDTLAEAAPLPGLTESFVRPAVGLDGEPPRETKKPRRYRFVRGKSAADRAPRKADGG